MSGGAVAVTVVLLLLNAFFVGAEFAAVLNGDRDRRKQSA